MKTIVYLLPEDLVKFLTDDKGTLIRPIPTDLLHIETLPGENEPSAWTVERYLKGGKAYQKCTRLYPFGKQTHNHLWLKSKRSRKAFYFEIASCRVVKSNGSWVWAIELKR